MRAVTISRARRPRGARLGRGPRPGARARARCSSTSSPPRSTGPTCCSGRGTTRRRRAPPSARPGVQRRHQRGRRGRDRLGGRATRSARCCPAAATPSGSPCRPGSCCRPAGVELATAAALPEVACTVWSNVFMSPGCARGERFLVHGGASGIGTMAIQLAARAGARVLDHRRQRRPSSPSAASWAPTITINYRDEDFVEGSRRRPTGAAPTSSWTSWARRTWPGTSTRWPPAAGWSSSACRAARRPSWTSGR